MLLGIFIPQSSKILGDPLHFLSHFPSGLYQENPQLPLSKGSHPFPETQSQLPLGNSLPPFIFHVVSLLAIYLAKEWKCSVGDSSLTLQVWDNQPASHSYTHSSPHTCPPPKKYLQSCFSSLSLHAQQFSGHHSFREEPFPFSLLFVSPFVCEVSTCDHWSHQKKQEGLHVFPQILEYDGYLRGVSTLICDTKTSMWPTGNLRMMIKTTTINQTAPPQVGSEHSILSWLLKKDCWQAKTVSSLNKLISCYYIRLSIENVLEEVNDFRIDSAFLVRGNHKIRSLWPF